MVENKMKRRDCTQKAFSLTELLVVVALLAILVSLLSPPLRSAMESARRLQCAHQQKQLATTAVLYAEDHGGINYVVNIGNWRNNMTHYAGAGISLYGEDVQNYICPSRLSPGFVEEDEGNGFSFMEEPGDKGRWNDDDWSGRNFYQVFKKSGKRLFINVHGSEPETATTWDSHYAIRKSHELTTSYQAWGFCSLYNWEDPNNKKIDKFYIMATDLARLDPELAIFSDIVIPGIPDGEGKLPRFLNNNPTSPIISGHVGASGVPEGGNVTRWDGSTEWKELLYVSGDDFYHWKRQSGSNGSGQFAWPENAFFMGYHQSFRGFYDKSVLPEASAHDDNVYVTKILVGEKNG